MSIIVLGASYARTLKSFIVTQLFPFSIWENLSLKKYSNWSKVTQLVSDETRVDSRPDSRSQAPITIYWITTLRTKVWDLLTYAHECQKDFTEDILSEVWTWQNDDEDGLESGASNLLASLGHNGKRVVLGRTLNTLWHVSQKNLIMF